MTFDPNAAAQPGSGAFGLFNSEADARVVLLPVPFDATTSYGKGAAKGPSAILEASRQVDLFDLETGKPYEAGIFMLEESGEVLAWNEEANALSARVIEAAGIVVGNAELEAALSAVNEISARVNEFTHREAARSPVPIGEAEPRRSEQLREHTARGRGAFDAEEPEDFVGSEEQRDAGEPEGESGRDEKGPGCHGAEVRVMRDPGIAPRT